MGKKAKLGQNATANMLVPVVGEEPTAYAVCDGSNREVTATTSHAPKGVKEKHAAAAEIQKAAEKKQHCEKKTKTDKKAKLGQHATANLLVPVVGEEPTANAVGDGSNREVTATTSHAPKGVKEKHAAAAEIQKAAEKKQHCEKKTKT